MDHKTIYINSETKNKYKCIDENPTSFVFILNKNSVFMIRLFFNSDSFYST